MNYLKNNKYVLILAGEASGDIHGAGLVREVKDKNPDLQFFGLGGDQMAGEGVEIAYHVREISFLGFFEVIKHLSFIRRVFKEMVNFLDEKVPCLVILIDYPGFNLRFAREAKKRGIPVLYYISPQVWAWGHGRVKKITKLVDRMLVIFPFEKDIYRAEGMDVQFVGHPLKDIVRIRQSKGEFFKELRLNTARPTIGILPGSRSQEINKLLPEMIDTCHLLKKKFPDLQAIVGFAPTVSDTIYKSILKEEEWICTVRDRIYEIMAHSDYVIVASGTATLETAILGTPMVILYKMSGLSYIIGKVLVKVKNIGLVNIVAERKIVSELLQGKVTAFNIAEELLCLMSDVEKRERLKHDLEQVSLRLGEKGATKRAAEAVVEFIDLLTTKNTEK